ncbi:aspartate/glutamate racemase family protein [Paenibacillus pabuli]|uniref:aspartate/glutamate racemase family protein n=1 Tax=Paenibacillus pabuli TaxID=1472 RepID=UPI000783DC8F|nr:aspartate/glutamate racemase family protein [Paenibacillus pabuli]MEC0127329.1 aspartate/glutamate racemase family protein [Paenibacillus pabuli]
MLGLIRVITLHDEEDIHRHGALIEGRYGIRVCSRCIPEQPLGVYDQATELESIPKIVDLARQLEHEGCTSIGISCAADPGLAEIRAAVRVPVYGAGACAAHLALTSAARVGVLTILEEVPALIRDILGEAYIGMGRPEGVVTTLDLNTPTGRLAAMEAASRLKAEGAESIVLACTGFATMGFAFEVEKELHIRALDPIYSLGAAVSAVNA